MKVDRSDPSVVRILVDNQAVAQLVGCPADLSLRWYDRDWREPGAAEIHASDADAIAAAHARIDREPDLGARMRAATQAKRRVMGYPQ